MDTTGPTTNAMPTFEQPRTPDPEISCRPRRRATTAMAATFAAAGVATAISAAPVVGLVSFNHNETLVRSPARRRRAVAAAAGAAAGVAAASASPLLAAIMFNHNETLVQTPLNAA